MRQLIDECRAKFGSAPRSFNWADRRYLSAAEPAWCQRDPLHSIYRDRNRILKHGRVVWGYVVQTNQRLFCIGPEDAPAAVVYSLDTPCDNAPELLEDLAKKIYELKGKTQGDSRLVNLSSLITNEMARPSKEPVPSLVAGDTNAILTTIMVMRKHMPFGFLSAHLLPLVVAPDQSEWTIVLPSRYWPVELVDRG